MRSKLLALACVVSTALSLESISFAGGCPSCRNGSCTIQTPVEVLVAPPSIAKNPNVPPTVKPACSACSTFTERHSRRAVVRLLSRVFRPRHTN